MGRGVSRDESRGCDVPPKTVEERNQVTGITSDESSTVMKPKRVEKKAVRLPFQQNTVELVPVKNKEFLDRRRRIFFLHSYINITVIL